MHLQNYNNTRNGLKQLPFLKNQPILSQCKGILPAIKLGLIMSGTIHPGLIASFDKGLTANQLWPPATILWGGAKLSGRPPDQIKT